MSHNTTHHHPHLIAVDWGTSALRAALICHGQTVAERHSDQGILHIPQNGFAQALTGFCGDWMAHPKALTLICGMAGSAQGWQLAPYMTCPNHLENLTQHLVWVLTDKVALVPGLACDLRLNPAQGMAYLSGLLIGEEIRAQANGLTGPLLVVANPVLQKRYQRALALIGFDCQTIGDEATWTGLQCLASLLARPGLGSMAS